MIQRTDATGYQKTALIPTESDNSAIAPLAPEEQAWPSVLQNAITDIETLWEELDLPSEELAAAKIAHQDFPIKVPRTWLNRIQRNHIDDPILKQVLPWQSELNDPAHFSPDPLEEADYNPVPGLIHKYAGRVLLVSTGACAINCRYCFRRHFAYEDNNPGRKGWQSALEYIQQDSSIHEVILSGGDPLALPDKQLQWLVTQIESIPHITTLRIHSRLPVAIPQRICPELLRWIKSTSLRVVMVIHANHPDEINQQVSESLSQLKQLNVTLLNQSVFLKGINDNPLILKALSERLFDAGVLPYYLHILDPVQGAAAFYLPLTAAKKVYQEFHSLVPGYLLPKLAQEISGEKGKTLLSSN